jgi:hypothetical protein
LYYLHSVVFFCNAFMHTGDFRLPPSSFFRFWLLLRTR